MAHAIADDFSAAEFHFISITSSFGDEVALDLDEEFGVAEANLVSDGGAVVFGVLGAGDFEWHGLEWSVDFPGEAPDFAFSGECDEFDYFFIAGLEADGAAGENIEAESTRGDAVEIEG